MIADNGSQDSPRRRAQPKDEDAQVLDELRSLLAGDQKQRLENLEQRVEDPERRAQDVAHVVAEAIEMRGRDDSSVSDALAPTIDETLTVSIRERPQEVADSLSPVMMPAIRKSIFDTIKSMMQSLNETLERSMSVKGLKWRWEAMRTGKPFAEVVLLRTLQYRVEHVFLIHRETGLLLHHLSGTAHAIEQPQAVSGMLTAIQDFVTDSFGGDDGETLELFQVGERVVRVERGPTTAVAAVVRGEPPLELNRLLREAQRKVRTDLGKELANFEGDPTPFAAAEPILAECLVSAKLPEAQKKRQKKNLLKSPLLWAGVVGAILLLSWFYASLAENRRWHNFLDRLDQEPGLVVVLSSSDDGFELIGWRDPQARDPLEILAAAQLAPEDVEMRWQPFASPHPDFVRGRIHRILAPPQGVSVEFDDGILRLRGKAAQGWIDDAKLLIRTIPEVTRVEWNQLAADGE